ncbi:MAG TPA: phage tail tape measure protein [Microvirga sp.]|jgi:phage-related minor tail protein|nr:phage tail tape measure protein [Microvirga sp.]
MNGSDQGAAWTGTARDTARELESLRGLADRFGDSLTRAFARGIAQGQAFDSILQGLGRSLVEMGLRAALAPLQSLVGNALGGLTQGLAGLTGFAHGGAISRGMVTPFAQGGVIASPAAFPLGRGLGLMGERGAEAVMPLARGPDGRLGVRGGGGRPMAVTVNIATPDVESFRRSEAQVSAALARAVARGQRGL